MSLGFSRTMHLVFRLMATPGAKILGILEVGLWDIFTVLRWRIDGFESAIRMKLGGPRGGQICSIINSAE